MEKGGMEKNIAKKVKLLLKSNKEMEKEQNIIIMVN